MPQPPYANCRNPTLHSILKLAEVLGMDPADLVRGLRAPDGDETLGGLVARVAPRVTVGRPRIAVPSRTEACRRGGTGPRQRCQDRASGALRL